ncbi:MAG: sigma-70 family RNA polymerase sigma factor [Alphaproteobacteria bacterium]|nr:sigma-70 family RNA polymerase sigma factor [Alphaproteobacteria bacterium]
MSERHDSDKTKNGTWPGLDRRFRAPLTAYFHRRVHDKAEAEDLTQEVFVRLTRRPDQHNGETIEAYVFKIAANVLNDWGRHRTSRRINAHRTLSDVAENFNLPPNLVEDRTPERVLAGKEALKDIEEALAELSERTREVFLLSRMENVHHRDIANLYGISVSAVEKHVLRAVAHLSARAFRT